ncbi:ANTAR domain-containing protein [Streptomyces javensis]|uniref:ANTAR domain-containing protein n=1 Tax=Streptomyces javensis TaxID=114698 RepID=UPI0033E176A7
MPEVIRLRRETVDPRAKPCSHPLIAQARGVLWERYRLPAEETAFTLLKRSSQAHDVRLRTLAAALLLDALEDPHRRALAAARRAAPRRAVSWHPSRRVPVGVLTALLGARRREDDHGCTGRDPLRRHPRAAVARDLPQ